MHNCASLIDSLVLLTNSDKLLKRMLEIGVDKVLKKVRLPGDADWEDVRLRVEVIMNQLIAVQAEVDEQKKEDEELPPLAE